MFARRVASALIAAPAFLLLLWLGGLYWAALWGALALVGAWEYATMLRRAGEAVWLAGLWLFVAWTAWAGARGGLPAALDARALLLLAAAAGVLAIAMRRYTVTGAAFTVHGALYLGWLPAHLVALRQAGLAQALGLFLAIWAADTAAYFSGRAWGKHKLAPAISPGKTWEGWIGGVLGAGLVAAVLYWPLGWLDPASATAIAVAAAWVGPLGDLYESAWKRHCGVKDSGAILPGHGGVLDRFDSALWAAPVAYYALTWLR